MKNSTVTWMLLLLAMAGCSGNPFARNDYTDEPRQKWLQTRAQMLYQVGAEHLKVGDLTRAGNKAREALTLDKDFHDARVLLAKVLIEKGHYAQAAVELNHVLAKKPDAGVVVYLLAVAREKDGKLADALEDYRRAYALDSRNTSALAGAAEVLVAMGRVDEARRFIEGYLAEAGEDPALHETAGRLAMMQEQYDKAADYFQGALDRDFKNPHYVESLGRAQFFAGRFEPAEATLKRLIGMEAYKKAAWAQTMLGDCHMAANHPLQARDAYQSAMELQPQEPGVWVNLSKAALAMGDLARANLSARQALDLEPERLDATLVAGYALIRQGQLKDAHAVLAPAYRRDPTNGLVLCLLGRMYSAGGNEEQASRCYAAAAKMDPTNRLAGKLAGPAPGSTAASAGGL